MRHLFGRRVSSSYQDHQLFPRVAPGKEQHSADLPSTAVLGDGLFLDRKELLRPASPTLMFRRAHFKSGGSVRTDVHIGAGGCNPGYIRPCDAEVPREYRLIRKYVPKRPFAGGCLRASMAGPRCRAGDRRKFARFGGGLCSGRTGVLARSCSTRALRMTGCAAATW